MSQPASPAHETPDDRSDENQNDCDQDDQANRTLDEDKRITLAHIQACSKHLFEHGTQDDGYNQGGNIESDFSRHIAKDTEDDENKDIENAVVDAVSP